MTKAILITGATGKQGGSVIDSLLKQKADVEILAVTRDVTSNAALKLQKKSSSIKLVQGNLDQPDAIFKSAQAVVSQPIWGVFSVQIPSITGGKEVEERQGKALVDTALKHNVQHFVYTSVDRGGDISLENPTNIPHFISKHNIEHHLIKSSKTTTTTWTILRPVAFLDNFAPGFPGKIFATCWKIALKGKPLQVIATSDIGFFGAQAFMKRDEYKGRGISLAGDELSFEDMSRIFKNKTGKDAPTTFSFICRPLLWMVKELGEMFDWFRESGCKADIGALRAMYPGLKDFGTWLETESAFIERNDSHGN